MTGVPTRVTGTKFCGFIDPICGLDRRSRSARCHPLSLSRSRRLVQPGSPKLNPPRPPPRSPCQRRLVLCRSCRGITGFSGALTLSTERRLRNLLGNWHPFGGAEPTVALRTLAPGALSPPGCFLRAPGWHRPSRHWYLQPRAHVVTSRCSAPQGWNPYVQRVQHLPPTGCILSPISADPLRSIPSDPLLRRGHSSDYGVAVPTRRSRSQHGSPVASAGPGWQVPRSWAALTRLVFSAARPPLWAAL